MSIKHERPSLERMMMPFDKAFLDRLPIFKKGFKGVDEMSEVENEVRIQMRAKNTENLAILDVGSADGEWLQKAMLTIWDKIYFPGAHFTALEPIADNPKLRMISEGRGVKWVKSYIESSYLDDESFDIVTSTHTAYYYHNQPLAHEEVSRILKPEGMLIVTLVSQFCVLNLLTEALLASHRQFTLNAEAYIALMSKLGMFQLEKVLLFRGGRMDSAFYESSDDNLRALACVLSRHRLPVHEIEESLGDFRKVLQKHESFERRNLIMFFRKKASGSTKDPQRMTRRRLEVEISALRSKFASTFESLSQDQRDILKGDLDAFATEATKSPVAETYLNELGERLAEAVRKAQRPVNEIRQSLNSIKSLVQSAK